MKLYQKVPKTPYNVYGNELCSENPFLKSPVLLCISAQPSIPKSVFGITKKGMQAARMRTTDSVAAGYDVSTFPITFLSITTSVSEQNAELEELVTKYFLPLVSQNGHRLPLKTAIKNFRNLNFLTYCDGTKTYLTIEMFLRKYLNLLEYSNEEIKQIISSCALIPIGTSNPTITTSEKETMSLQDSYATTFQFLDIKDEELEDITFPEHLSNLTTTPITDINKSYFEILQQVESTNPFPHCIELNHNHAIHYYIGTGVHSLKEYINANKLISVSISTVLTNILENSLKNYHNKDFYPINIKELHEKVNDMLLKASKGIPPEILLTQLDKTLNYGGIPKLSPKKALEQTKLEIENKKLFFTQNEIDSTTNKIITLKEQVLTLMNYLKNHLDPATQTEILNMLSISIPSSPKNNEKISTLSDTLEKKQYLNDYYNQLSTHLTTLIITLSENTSFEEFNHIINAEKLGQYIGFYHLNNHQNKKGPKNI